MSTMKDLEEGSEVKIDIASPADGGFRRDSAGRFQKVPFPFLLGYFLFGAFLLGLIVRSPVQRDFLHFYAPLIGRQFVHLATLIGHFGFSF